MRKLKKSRILITGATGFLGRRLAKRLAGSGHEVYLTSGHGNQKLNILKLDLKNLNHVKRAISEIKPTIIYHTAALVDLSRDYKIAKKCIDTNIKGTLNLLESLKKHKPEMFIFTSSEEIYGDGRIPSSEEQLPRPPSPYAISNIAGEEMCSFYSRLLGFSLIVFRISTMYGPNNHPWRLLPTIVAKAIHNKDILLNSGTKRRDYVYVDDVVDALTTPAKYRRFRDQVEIINIGGGISYSLLEITDHIVRLSKSKSTILTHVFPDRILEADEWLLNITKAKNLLKWEPKTSLDEGLRKTITYFKKSEA